MSAFVVVLVAAGWRPGGQFPSGHVLLAVSGAAFSAVALGQMVNAFACRSTGCWPGSLGWTSNRLLLGAVITELLALAGFLFITPLASLLGHAPPLWGWVVAALAVPAVLATDAAHKTIRARRYKRGEANLRSQDAPPGPPVR